MEAKEAIKRISEMIWDWKQTGYQSDKNIQAVELALNFLKEHHPTAVVDCKCGQTVEVRLDTLSKGNGMYNNQWIIECGACGMNTGHQDTEKLAKELWDSVMGCE